MKESVHVAEESEKATQSVPVHQRNMCISIGETVLMPTTLTEVSNTSSARTEQIRVLLDSGSQRTYITEELAKTLMLEGGDEQEIHLVTCGSTSPKIKKTKSAQLQLKQRDGTLMKITENIVPSITGFYKDNLWHSNQRKGLRKWLRSSISQILFNLKRSPILFRY